MQRLISPLLPPETARDRESWGRWGSVSLQKICQLEERVEFDVLSQQRASAVTLGSLAAPPLLPAPAALQQLPQLKVKKDIQRRDGDGIL
ncbi:unnamed protein product [Arctogadus glacialis]